MATPQLFGDKTTFGSGAPPPEPESEQISSVARQVMGRGLAQAALAGMARGAPAPGIEQPAPAAPVPRGTLGPSVVMPEADPEATPMAPVLPVADSPEGVAGQVVPNEAWVQRQAGPAPTLPPGPDPTTTPDMLEDLSARGREFARTGARQQAKMAFAQGLLNSAPAYSTRADPYAAMRGGFNRMLGAFLLKRTAQESAEFSHQRAIEVAEALGGATTYRGLMQRAAAIGATSGETRPFLAAFDQQKADRMAVFNAQNERYDAALKDHRDHAQAETAAIGKDARAAYYKREASITAAFIELGASITEDILSGESLKATGNPLTVEQAEAAEGKLRDDLREKRLTSMAQTTGTSLANQMANPLVDIPRFSPMIQEEGSYVLMGESGAERRVPLPIPDQYVIFDAADYDIPDEATRAALTATIQALRTHQNAQHMEEAMLFEGPGSPAYAQAAAAGPAAAATPLLLNRSYDLAREKVRLLESVYAQIGMDGPFISRLMDVVDGQELLDRQRYGALIQRQSDEAAAKGQFGVPTHTAGDPPSDELAAKSETHDYWKERWRQRFGIQDVQRILASARANRTGEEGARIKPYYTYSPLWEREAEAEIIAMYPLRRERRRWSLEILRDEYQNKLEGAMDRFLELREKVNANRATEAEFTEAHHLAQMFAARK